MFVLRKKQIDNSFVFLLNGDLFPMSVKSFVKLAEEIISGAAPDLEACKAILTLPGSEVLASLAGADLIRNHYFGREVHLCTICNGKSGRCSENCTFCSQAVGSKTEAPIYPLMESSELIEGGVRAAETEINRFSIVTGGKGLSSKEIRLVANVMAKLDVNKIRKCASLGILGLEDFRVLKKAGVDRYHHNLETAESHYPNICTSNSYQNRVNTIKAAKEADMTVCTGGIFGIGETDEQILEMALTLKELDVESIPLNFLTPIKGTPLEDYDLLTPLRCLKIIALFRYILPDREILVCGGREENLKNLHPLIFYAGASGTMTGNYLTTPGRTLEKDLAMIRQLGFTVRDQTTNAERS